MRVIKPIYTLSVAHRLACIRISVCLSQPPTQQWGTRVEWKPANVLAEEGCSALAPVTSWADDSLLGGRGAGCGTVGCSAASPDFTHWVPATSPANVFKRCPHRGQNRPWWTAPGLKYRVTGVRLILALPLPSQVPRAEYFTFRPLFPDLSSRDDEVSTSESLCKN